MADFLGEGAQPLDPGFSQWLGLASIHSHWNYEPTMASRPSSGSTSLPLPKEWGAESTVWMVCHHLCIGLPSLGTVKILLGHKAQARRSGLVDLATSGPETIARQLL